VRFILYRVKQFLWHLNTRISTKEKIYVLNHLDDIEYNIFNKLSKAEQKHSIRVAIKIEEICEEYKSKGINVDRDKLIIAALLHDIGKAYKKLNIIDKSVIVILDKITRGKLKKYTMFKKIDTYYNHAEKGANILKGLKYDEKIIYLIENHHKDIGKNEENQNLELLALIYSDSVS
jgi:putative nucleotidyltransferase with HDIG domain